MLNSIQRDDVRPPHQPHSNMIKGFSHTHVFGNCDFPNERKTSTNTHFFQERQRIKNDFKPKHPSWSQITTNYGHNNNRIPNSMTKNDFTNFKFSNSQRNPTVPQSTFGKMQDSSSLLNRDITKNLEAVRSKPMRSRVELMGSEINFGAQKGAKSSHYTYSYCNKQDKPPLPQLRSRTQTRAYNILTNKPQSDKTKTAYEFFRDNEGRNRNGAIKSQVPPKKERFFMY